MGRNKQFYFQNRYFISGIRYAALLESNSDLMGEAITTIIKNYNLDFNIVWRFNKLSNIEGKGNLELDLSRVNIANNQREDPIIINVNTKIIDITKTMIAESLTDEEIGRQVYSRLMKEGYKMENNVLVKNESTKVITLNICADLGNNFSKAGCKDKVIRFLNKVDFERDETMLAENDYIKFAEDDIYHIIGNEFSKFEKNEYKKDKNFLPSLNFSIANLIKELGLCNENSEFNINLGILSPINQIKLKDEYIKKIMEESIHECICRINGKVVKLTINIEKVEMFAEGLCAFPMLEDKSGTQIICDVGSQTANIVVIRNGKVVKVQTLPDMGSFNYYRDLVKNIKDNEVNIDNIQRYIDDNICEHDIELLKKYYKKLFTETKRVVDSKVTKYNVIGGTVELFKSLGIEPKANSNITFVENASEINVRGALQMLNAKYKVAGE